MVVVFIPPAVDPGEPPMSIKTIMSIWPASVIFVRSAVLKPAVLGVTDWNRELNSRVPRQLRKFKEEKPGGRSCDQHCRCHQDHLALHPVPAEMEPVPLHILPGQKADASYDDERHDRQIDHWLGRVCSQGGKSHGKWTYTF